MHSPRAPLRVVFARYLAFEIPGWLLAGGVLWALIEWWDLAPRTALLLFALWVAKDLLLFPVLRIAYEPQSGGGADALIGARGTATQHLDPAGYVRIGAELWRARLAGGHDALPIGAAVRVCEVRGLELIVEPDPA